MSGSKNQACNFNLQGALYTADSYMRLAHQATNDLSKQDDSSKRCGPILLAISSLAFALEVYFKAIIYSTKQKIAVGHDLDELWNELPEVVREWLTKNFEDNYKSKGENWGTILMRAPSSSDSNIIKAESPGFTAPDIIKGHRLAFTIARYGYELTPELRAVSYNIDGLRLLSWLTRRMAIDVTEARISLEKSSKDKSGTRSISIPQPSGVIERFPID